MGRSGALAQILPRISGGANQKCQSEFFEDMSHYVQHRPILGSETARRSDQLQHPCEPSWMGRAASFARLFQRVFWSGCTGFGGVGAVVVWRRAATWATDLALFKLDDCRLALGLFGAGTVAGGDMNASRVSTLKVDHETGVKCSLMRSQLMAKATVRSCGARFADLRPGGCMMGTRCVCGMPQLARPTWRRSK